MKPWIGVFHLKLRTSLLNDETEIKGVRGHKFLKDISEDHTFFNVVNIAVIDAVIYISVLCLILLILT